MEDKELIQSWFAHIEQLATDRKTATGAVMDLQHTLDEIRCLARDSQYYIKHLVKQEATMDVYKFTCTEYYGGGEVIVAAWSKEQAYGLLCAYNEFIGSSFSLEQCKKVEQLKACVKEPAVISVEYYAE